MVTRTSQSHSQSIPLFADHPQVMARLMPHLREMHAARGQAVLHHGDAATQLYFIQRGWIKLTRQTPDGKETVLGLCAAGDVFGEAALFPHAQYPYHADALQDTTLHHAPADVLRGLLSEDAELAQTIMELLNSRIAQTQLKLEHMSTLSTAQRLGCFFLRLCHTDGDVGTSRKLEIPVEKHVLAGYLGMKPETLSRSQQQLKAVGVEVHGAQVHVSCVVKLRQFVCGSCSESGSCETEDSAT